MEQRIEIVISSDSKGVVTGVKTATGEIKKLNTSVSKSEKSFKKFGGSATKGIDGIAKSFLRLAGITSVALVFRKAFDEADKFNQKLAEITVMMKDTTPLAVGNLENSINSLSVETGQFTEDTAAGAWQLVSAFGESSLASEKLEIAMKGATAGSAQVNETVSLLSANMKAFGNTSDEMAQKVIDLGIKTNELGETSFAQLAQNMTRTVPLFSALGGEIEELYAMYATLTGVTGNTSEVTTQLASAMGAIIKPTTNLKKLMGELGYSSGEAMVKELGLVGAFRKIVGSTDGTSTALGRLIVRKEALNAILTLTGKQSDVFREKLGKMYTEAGGTGAKAFEKMTTGVNKAGFEFKQARVKLQVFMQDFGKLLQQGVSILIKFSDVLIRVGIILASVFLANKLQPFFSAMSAGFSSMQTYYKVLRLEGVSAMGAFTGSIKTATGMTAGLAAKIKALPTMVKITIVAIGVDLFIRSLNKILSGISKLHDKGMSLIIKDAKETTAKAHDMTKAFMKFADASDVNREALSRAKEELKKYTEDTDSALIKNTLLKQLLEAFYPEWSRYQKKLKEIGSDNENLSVSLEENNEQYEKIRKNIESYTGKELEKYLDKLVDQEKLTDVQKDKLIELHETLKKTREEYESLAKSIDVLTKQGMSEQTKKIDYLVKMFDDYREQILSSDEISKKWRETLEKLYKTALPEEKEQLAEVLNQIKISVPAIDNYAEAIRLTTEAMKTFDYATGKFKYEMPGVTKMLSDMTKKTIKMAKEIGKAGNEVEETEKKVDSLGETFNQLSNLIGNAIAAIKNFGINLGGFEDIVGGVASGLSSVGGGLNAIKGAGGGFTGFLQKATGYIGVFSGALSVGISLFKGFIKLISGPSGELEAARRRLEGIQMNTSGWGERVEKLAKQLKGADTAGRAFNALLADMIRDSDITIDTFDNYIRKVREIVSTYEQGSATAKETAKNFGTAFEAIAETAASLGIEASDYMMGLINLADEFGLDVQGIADYVAEKMKAGLESYKKIKDIQAIDITDIQEKINELTESLKGLDIGSDEFRETANEIENLKKQIFDVQAAQRVFGDLSIDVFEDMIAYQEKVADNSNLIAGIEAATNSIINLSAAQRLTQDQFSQFEQVAMKAYAELQNAGFSNVEIYDQLGDMLTQLDYLEREYGYTIDENLKTIIQSGKEQELLKEKGKSTTEILGQGFDRVVEALHLVARGLGVDIPDAMENFSYRTTTGIDNARSSFNSLNTTINDSINAVESLGDEVEKTDDRVHDAISGNSMYDEFAYVFTPAIREAIREIINVGKEIENVDKDIWGKSITNMKDTIDDLTGQSEKLTEQIEILSKKKRINDTDKELLDLYKKQLEEINSQIDKLTELQALREEALAVPGNIGGQNITANNIGIYTSQLGVIIDAFVKGAITAKEFQDTVGSAFNNIISAAKELGIEGSKYILEFIKKSRSMGEEIPAVTKYISEQLSFGIKDGLDKYLESFADPSVFRDAIAEIEEKLKTAKGKEREDLLESLKFQKEELNKAVKDIKQNYGSIEAYTMSFFSSLIAEGATFNQAIMQMGDQLDMIVKMTHQTGAEPGTELKELLDFRDFLSQNKEVINRLDGMTQMMKSLGNVGHMTNKIFKQFEFDTQKIFDQLTSGAINAEDNIQALQAIAPQLGQLLWYSQQYGYELDENTKKLIAQAQAHGINMEQMIPAEDKMVALLEKIVELFGGEIPYAVGKMVDSVVTEVGVINDALLGIAIPDITVTPNIDIEKYKSDIVKLGTITIGGSGSLDAWQENYNKVKNQINANREKLTTTGLGGYKGTGLTYVEVKTLQAENTELWKILTKMNENKPKYATGGFFEVGGMSGGIDRTPVNFLATRGEAVRVYSREEYADMRRNRNNTGTGTESYGFDRQNYNETNYNDISISVNSATGDSDYDLAMRVKRIARNNTAGAMTEVRKQAQKRA
jgi:TP901 family phage tail tape measure protein